MIKGNTRERVNVEKILEEISEYEIYRHYLGRDFVLGRNTHSPFRRDSTPSFNIYADRKGRLKHIDYGDSEFRGDCINFVMQLEDLSYKDAVKKINEDLLGENNKRQIIKIPDIKPKERKRIQVISKKFTKEELDYWAQYHITEQELKDNQVYSVSRLYIDKVYIPNYKRELRFAYIFGDLVKIYTPYASNKENKFITNTPIDCMSGLDKLGEGDTVVVTKSKKDEIVLRKFIPNVCSVQAENIKAINPENISMLKSKYKNVIINFDSDEPGVKTSQHYNQYGFGYINVPKKYSPIKDYSDLIKEKGTCLVQEELRSMQVQE
jgi:hypothetical protein